MIMSNSQSFDFSSLKRISVDSLIMKCKGYVEQYLSKSAAECLDKAYKASEFDEVKHILNETLKKIKTKMKLSDYHKAKQAVRNGLLDEKLFEYSDNDERRQNDNMGTGSVIIAFIVITVAIIVIAIVGTVIYSKINKKTVGEVLPLGLSKDNKTNNVSKYTDKDRDMMALIHELSIIYENTDKYLNS